MAQPTTTKDFVEVSEARDNVLILKNGSLRGVIEATSINFELKSNDEQLALVGGFQNMLNALDFPLQILIHSRKLDISSYLKSLDSVIENQKNELLKIQATEYSRFIKGLTDLANIMAKKFYVVVPYYAIELPASSNGLLGTFKSIVGGSKYTQQMSEEQFQNYRGQLEQRMGVVAGGLSGLGLETRTLTQTELINLYYGYYNPGQKLSAF